jgi:hypothetical protein
MAPRGNDEVTAVLVTNDVQIRSAARRKAQATSQQSGFCEGMAAKMRGVGANILHSTPYFLLEMGMAAKMRGVGANVLHATPYFLLETTRSKCKSQTSVDFKSLQCPMADPVAGTGRSRKWHGLGNEVPHLRRCEDCA